ncbi:hypothetical protein Q3C62_00020 [Enterococcus faecium]|nr:hypothetical protein [Enterococcus faecium]MDQ8297132.1 hypothetical protein [Enterococcus faecium]MDQ8351547.1 hypothetical protein [Enterococcus faecium]MDQ8431249.1 hypothetical protein [Enterococcus faecium]MDQ8517043.1 hypothetical protein [Enterococcus faecium]
MIKINRVKFYSKGDLIAPTFLSRIKEIIDAFLNNPKLPSSFEEAIEIQNVVKYIDAEIFSKDWSPEYIEKIKDAKTVLKKSVDKYLGTAKKEEILDSMGELSYEYRDDFFENFANFKYANRISEEEFMKEFNRIGIPIRYLLKSQYFIKVYAASIKSYILADPLSIELLISNFIEVNKEKLYFPDNISKEEWDRLLDEYIDVSNANLNYMTILENPIQKLDGKKYFNVTPKQKLRIIDRSEEFNKKIISKDSGVLLSSTVYIQREDYEEAVDKEKNQMTIQEAVDRSILNNILAATGGTGTQQFQCSMSALIDKEQIDNDHSFDSLLKYFSEDFKFFTEKLIANLPSYPNKEMGTVSKTMGVKTNDSYDHGIYFKVKNQLAVSKVQTISSILSRWNLDIESLIDWFFTEYCVKQYGVSWLPLYLPHKDENIGNRTSTFFRIEESIRTQYLVFTEENEIKSDLVNETSTPSISNLKSLLPKKYAYLSENDLAENLLYLIFDDQSLINFINEEIKGDSFFDLLLNHDVTISDFPEYDRETLQYLIDNKILTEKNDILQFENITKIMLLREIYLFGSTSYLHSSSEEKAALDELESEELIIFSSTFFTKQESDYLNFLLNNKVFDNSWAIRNRYQHGVPNYDDSTMYDTDNAISLLILMIYVVKIDDELKSRHQ